MQQYKNSENCTICSNISDDVFVSRWKSCTQWGPHCHMFVHLHNEEFIIIFFKWESNDSNNIFFYKVGNNVVFAFSTAKYTLQDKRVILVAFWNISFNIARPIVMLHPRMQFDFILGNRNDRGRSQILKYTSMPSEGNIICLEILISIAHRCA